MKQILYWPIRYSVTKVKTGRKLIKLLQKRPGINRNFFLKIWQCFVRTSAPGVQYYGQVIILILELLFLTMKA